MNYERVVKFCGVSRYQNVTFVGNIALANILVIVFHLIVIKNYKQVPIEIIDHIGLCGLLVSTICLLTMLSFGIIKFKERMRVYLCLSVLTVAVLNTIYGLMMVLI